jgi:hypothetical protein
VSSEALLGFHSSISTSALYVGISSTPAAKSLKLCRTEARYHTTPAYLIPSLHSIACRTTSPAPPLTYILFAPSAPRNFALRLLTVLYNHSLHTYSQPANTQIYSTHNQHSHHTRTRKYHSPPHQQHHSCSSLLLPRLQVHRLHGLRHSRSFLCRSSLRPSFQGSRPIRCSLLSWWFRSGSGSRVPSTSGISHGPAEPIRRC